ncbi:MAG: hypothetical protein ACLRIT_07605 [Blautia sp.]
MIIFLEIVRDDMTTTIAKGSKVSVAAACVFHVYAYKELEKQLEGVGEFASYIHFTYFYN